MKQPQSESKTFSLLKNVDFSLCGLDSPLAVPDDSFFQLTVITKLLDHFISSPKVQQDYGDGCILQNLNHILCNLHELIPHNPFVVLKSAKVVNKFAFKNSMDVRLQMKYLKMFELRDQLIVDHLINVAEIVLTEHELADRENLAISTQGKKELLKSVSEFSYDVVAAKSMFQDNFGGEILVMVFLFVLKTPFNLSEQECKKLQSELLTIISQELLQYKQISSFLGLTFPEFMTALQQCIHENQNEAATLARLKTTLAAHLKPANKQFLKQLNVLIGERHSRN